MIMTTRTKSGSGVKRREFIHGSAAVLATAGLGMRQARAANEVTMAGLWPLTGPGSAWGVKNARGEQIVYELYNERGGVKSLGGAKIKHLLLDTETQVRIAAVRAEELASQPQVSVISGTSQSAASLVVSQICERVGIPFVAPVDIEPTLTSRGFKNTFRVSISMENVAHDLIQFLHEAGKDIGPPIKKIAIVCEDSVLGKTTVASLAKFSKENGFNVVESITYNAASTSDFTGIVSRLKRSGADALVGYNLTQDAIQLIRTCVELDFNPTAVGAAMGGAVGLSFSDALKSLSNGILVVQPYSNDLNLPGLEEFKVRYETRFREEADLSSVATANAAHVVIQALEKAASTDRGAIRNALEGVDLGLDGNILLPSGCKFKNGDNIRAVSVVTQLKDGAYRAVAPKEFASTKAVWPKPNWS